MKYINIFTLTFLLTFFSLKLFASQKQEIKAIESYLNSIKNIEANFIQENPDGSLTEGKYYLSKPGKFRWEYKNQPILLIANGKSLIYYDKELEQADYYPIEKTIASLITRRVIKFQGDVRIISYKRTKNSTEIALNKKNQKDIGEFSFVFKNNPLELKKIKLVDGQKNKLLITFINMKINKTKPNKNLFKIKDPRFK
jgi:outer membrane lipoprotein-sorting protein